MGNALDQHYPYAFQAKTHWSFIHHLDEVPLETPLLWFGPGFADPGDEILCLDFAPFVVIFDPADSKKLKPFFSDPRFTCGWIAYEIGYALNPVKGVRPSSWRLPLAWWGCPGTLLIRKGDEIYGYTRFRKRIQELKSWLFRECRSLIKEPTGRWLDRDFDSFETYKVAFDAAKSAIREGECYQINLTERRHFEWTADPLCLMARMLRVQPARWSSFFGDGTRAILCGSPEMGLTVVHRRVTARPMKGTRPRNRSAASLSRVEEDLYRSAKERAENLMVVDMWRNDLARVCRPGSVRVPRLFVIETYETLYQMVSEVVGDLDETATEWDCLNATFPSPSVTGAPKIRAMEWIARLEHSSRGVYCGTMGWVWPGEGMRLNVAIRTAEWMDGEGWYGVGGGIVADSEVAQEWAELDWKTRAFTLALQGEFE